MNVYEPTTPTETQVGLIALRRIYNHFLSIEEKSFEARSSEEDALHDYFAFSDIHNSIDDMDEHMGKCAGKVLRDVVVQLVAQMGPWPN